MNPQIWQPGSELSSTFTFPPSDPAAMPSQERSSPPYADFSTLPPPFTLKRYSSSPKPFPTVKLDPPPIPEYVPVAAPVTNPRGAGGKAKSFFRSLAPQTRRRASYSRRGSITRDPLSITSIAFDPTALDIPGPAPSSRRPRTQSSFSLLRFAKGLQPHRSGNSVDSQSSTASSDSASSLAPPSFRKPRRTHSEGILRSRPSTPISRPGTPNSAHTTPFPTLRHSPSTPSMFNPMSQQGRQRLVAAGARVASSRGSRSLICTPRARPGIPTMWVSDLGAMCASPSTSVDDLMSVDSLEVGDDPFASQPMQHPVIPFPTPTPSSPTKSLFLQPSDAESIHYDNFAPRPNTPHDIRESIETLRGPDPRPRFDSGASLGSVFSDDSDDGRSTSSPRPRRASVLAAVDSLVRKVKGEDDGGGKGGKWW